MTDEQKPREPREYYWVPEQAIFDSAGDATEFMDLGAGCLVANHVLYDQIKSAYAALQKELEKLRSFLSPGGKQEFLLLEQRDKLTADNAKLRDAVECAKTALTELIEFHDDSMDLIGDLAGTFSRSYERDEHSVPKSIRGWLVEAGRLCDKNSDELNFAKRAREALAKVSAILK